LLLCGILFLPAPAPASNGGRGSPSTPASASLEGKLTLGKDGSLHLSTAAGAVAITADDPALLHTLQDSRLEGRDLRVEGARLPGGRFDVLHLRVVRDGKLYRLRYYCHVCNIAATEPGNCVCCQRPTELEEIPADQATDDMTLVP